MRPKMMMPFDAQPPQRKCVSCSICKLATKQTCPKGQSLLYALLTLQPEARRDATMVSVTASIITETSPVIQ